MMMIIMMMAKKHLLLLLCGALLFLGAFGMNAIDDFTIDNNMKKVSSLQSV